MTTTHTRVWQALDEPRMEYAEIAIGTDSLRATGVQVGTDPEPYRLEYELETGSAFVTRRLSVRSRGDGWSRELDLEHDGAGSWTAPGNDVAALEGALDCDLGLCPVTNAMPVLRHQLHYGGEPRDFLMAWVSVPDLVVTPSLQRYEPVSQTDRGSIVRYVGEGGEFVAELELDEHGLVVLYPELAELAGR